MTISALSGFSPYRSAALRFGAESASASEASVGAGAGETETIKDPASEAPNASATPEAPRAENSGFFRALKSVAYSAAGLALLLIPQRLGVSIGARAGGLLAIPLTVTLMIPFVIVKDMVSNHASRQGVKDYSDLRVLRAILDRNMREKTESLLKHTPFIKDETRQKLLNSWMDIYNTRVRSALDWVGVSIGMGDSARIPELETLPDRLKEKETRREKLEVIMMTLFVATRRAALVSGRRLLSVKALGGGALALVLFKPLHAMFEKLVGAEAQRAEEELKAYEAARAARFQEEAAATGPAFA
ncbi:MAG: hypothetical protein IPK79_11160 [Vampirovibrionales bacterium]|nr:hypothetical protein [Vampirovibrionales bacterium]